MAEISLTKVPEGLDSESAATQVWNILIATGLAMTISGVLHLAVGWYPLRIHNAHWKFMTAGATIDGFPVITASMTALGFGLIARRSTRLLRLFAATAALAALGLAAVYAVFLSTLPRIGQLAESVVDSEVVQTGVYRASGSAIVTILLLGGLAWVAWERAAVGPNRN